MQSQPGRRSRSGRADPAVMASKYRSSGWRRDLEHVLKVYYKHTVQAPFRESEWARVRELFFDRFVPKKAEALVIKEESPLDYMPFIAKEFQMATGLRLNDLPEFTLWLKRGSYFHGLLVERGQVQECPHSQSRRWETGLAFCFPLQDTEGRLASIERLYEYAGEQPLPQDDVAGRAIRYLHPEILPRDARRLGNQVVCMITEYHLTSNARVSTTLSLVVLEAAKLLLPAIKTYVSNVSFEGTRDVRVLDRAICRP